MISFPRNAVPAPAAVLALILTATAFLHGDPASIIPPGDPVRGEQVFLDKRCFRCHTVEGRQLPDFDLPASLKLHLGGENHRQWSRDAWAQAIMNPDHVISPQYQAAMVSGNDPAAARETPMPNFNRELTVSELVDLASFLGRTP